MQRELVSPTEVWLQAAIGVGTWREPLEACARSLGAREVLLGWSYSKGELTIEAQDGSSPDFVRLCRDLANDVGRDVLERQEPGLGWLTWAQAQGAEPSQRVALFVLSDQPVAHQSLRAIAASAASALATRANLDAMRLTSSLMTQACDQLRTGLVVVDADLKILTSNTSWGALLARRDGLSALSGRLVCRDRGDQAVLATAVGAVLSGRLGEATVKARRAGGAEPYVLRAVAARAQAHAAGHCLLMVVDPDEAPALNSDIWRAMFELTECELIIAEALLSGRRISDVATRRGVSRETIRSQTKRMFARLRVSSQVEAAVRLSRTTPFRAMPARSEA